MRARFDEMGGGGVGEADAVPENPLAQNAATEALKPKAKPVPAVGASLDDPNAPPLPGVQASTSAPAVNMDPNAYAPPPQSLPMDVSTAGGPMGQVAPGSFNPAAQKPGADALGGMLGQLGKVNAGVAPLGSKSNPGFDQGFADAIAAQNGTMPATPPATLPTLSGDWQAPTASAGSSPLIATAAGGTMTPEGNAANQFRGYETDQGGKFGGYDSVPLAGDAAGRTFKTYDQDFVKNANAMKQVPPLSEAEWQAMTAADSGANAVKDKIANGQPVSDKELAFVRRARGMELQQDTAAPTFGTFGTKAGGTTAADPAEQERLLAGQAAGTVPSGPASQQSLPSLNPSGLTPSGKDPRQEWVQQQLAGMKPDFGGAAPAGGPEATALKPNILTTLTGGQNTGATPTLPTVGPSGQPATASGMGNVAQTATTAENALTNSLLSRGAGADRFKIASDQWDAFQKSTAPQYEADQRSAMRRAAAGGALGSGMLQTSLGDLSLNRANSLDAQKQNFLSEALKGTIADQFGDVGIAQQQQGFQQGQQQQAFGNEVTREQLQESLTNGSFQRALQQLTAGSSGNPADTALLLSQIFGGQASQAGSSLAALLGGLGQKNAAGGTTSGGSTADIVTLLSQLFGGNKETTTPTSTTTYGGQ